MARAFARYLVNEDASKHFFLAALLNDRTERWQVYTAWGKLGTVWKEKEYDGGKDQHFTGRKNAEAYAKAILKSKEDDGFDVKWSDSHGGDAGDFVEGERPDWWEKAVEKNLDHFGGRAPITPPLGLSSRNNEERSTPKKIEALKEKMASKVAAKEAKVKIEAGKAKIAVKQPEKAKEEARVIKPRFGYAPRK